MAIDGRRLSHTSKEEPMGVSRILRIIATICFALAAVGITPTGVSLIPVGLALWCGSTLVP